MLINLEIWLSLWLWNREMIWGDFLDVWKNHPINNFTITKTTTPGNPNNPTKTLVKKLSPIWKPKLAPTMLIKKITTPPIIEFKTSFNIFLIGTMKILPNKNKKQIHAKYVIILIFIKIPLFANPLLLLVCKERTNNNFFSY